MTTIDGLPAAHYSRRDPGTPPTTIIFDEYGNAFNIPRHLIDLHAHVAYIPAEGEPAGTFTAVDVHDIHFNVPTNTVTATCNRHESES